MYVRRRSYGYNRRRVSRARLVRRPRVSRYRSVSVRYRRR